MSVTQRRSGSQVLPATDQRVAATISRAALDLYGDLAHLADAEYLLAWPPSHLDVTAAPELADEGLLFTYHAGRPRGTFAYLVSSRPGPNVGAPRSLFPPPSLQSGPTWTMYRRRDGDVCHLCGQPISEYWKWPHLFPSVDHLIPRSKGGNDYPSNIRISHQTCNKARRDRDLAASRMRLTACGPRQRGV
jgi:hypothetical protein